MGRAETGPRSSEEDARWRGRPLASAFLRVAVLVAPIAASVAVSIPVLRVLPASETAWKVALRLGVGLAIASAVVFAVDRAARRVLPLAVLLQLALVFPQRAPSRFRLARQAASVRHLAAVAERARRDGLADDPARAAEQILALVAAVEGHDRATRGHSERVRVLTDMIAEEVRLPRRDRDRLRWAALLHDVGKLMVPAEVLRKPTALDDGEWDLIRRHPPDGARLASPLKDWLGEPWRAIEEHHERYDGRGYPAGLAGAEITFGARIVAVADSYETMTARRPYRRTMRPAQAREELARCSGSQFDPSVVRAFLRIPLRRLGLVTGSLAWLAQIPFLRGIEQVATVAAGAAAVGGTALVIGLGPPASSPAVGSVPDAAAAVARTVASSTLRGGPLPGPRPADPRIPPEPTPSPSGDGPSPTPTPTRSKDPLPAAPSPSPTLEPSSDPLPPIPTEIIPPPF